MPVHAQLNGLYTAPADPTEIRTFRPVGSHLGDKTSEWWLARDQDVFVLMHNALRGEVTKLESVLFTLGDKTLKEWEIQAIRVRRRVAFVRSRGVYTCASTTTTICVRSFFPSRRARATPAIGVDARAARDRARARCRRAPSLSRDARGGGAFERAVPPSPVALDAAGVVFNRQSASVSSDRTAPFIHQFRANSHHDPSSPSPPPPRRTTGRATTRA